VFLLPQWGHSGNGFVFCYGEKRCEGLLAVITKVFEGGHGVSFHSSSKRTPRQIYIEDARESSPVPCILFRLRWEFHNFDLNKNTTASTMNYEISDFQIDVIKRSNELPVLVDFWADWCGPCKVLGPILERLAEKGNSQWALAKVNTDLHQDIAATYGIRGIPHVKLFVDGKVTSEFTGALPEQAVTLWLRKALPNRFRKEIEEAGKLLDQHKTGEAQAMLERVLVEDPGNDHARVLLAGSLLATNADRAQNLVAGIEEHSEHFPMVESIRTFTSLTSRLLHPETLPDDPVKPDYLAGLHDLATLNYDGALKRFIAVIRANRAYDDDGARRACVAIFRILGDEHELTGKWRREFSSALYA
jgi:putative thioredoxin